MRTKYGIKNVNVFVKYLYCWIYCPLKGISSTNSDSISFFNSNYFIKSHKGSQGYYILEKVTCWGKATLTHCMSAGLLTRFSLWSCEVKFRTETVTQEWVTDYNSLSGFRDLFSNDLSTLNIVFKSTFPLHP